jgi:adenylate cyclase
MGASWQLLLYQDKELVHTAVLAGAVELGREKGPDETLYSQRPLSGGQRLVIAHKEEKSVSRQHALIEPLPEGGFRLTNLSDERPIGLPDGTELTTKAACTVPANALLTIGKKTFRLQAAADESPPLHSLSEATTPPGRSSRAAGSLLGLPTTAVAGAEKKALLPWLQAVMDVLQSAASSADFYDKAARAVVELVRLDSGRVMLLKGDVWLDQALHTTPRFAGEASGPPSRHVLGRVRQEKRTFWQAPGPALPDAPSLRDVEAVVAAPILNRNGTVIGALYGDRRLESGPSAAGPITEGEALLVELLARGVAAGLARLEQEQTAAALRVQFEQFFSPDLARELLTRPDLLIGRKVEVSVLFCDIRRYSAISGRLSPERNVEWVGDVLGAASECVLAEGGVLVDYIGDALMAMWGAPQPQSDHAARAGRAALAMLARMPELNARWQEMLEEPMSLGVGVNTGEAHVGNTGSRHKFQYGALGHEVNLASRVQGATKYFKTDLLVTEATRRGLGAAFAVRRLCSVRVVNIGDPVALYELSAGGVGWSDRAARYELALADFEAGRFRQAARALGGLLGDHPGDGPAMLLLSRAAACMVEEPEPFDPVWVLPGK